MTRGNYKPTAYITHSFNLVRVMEHTHTHTHTLGWITLSLSEQLVQSIKIDKESLALASMARDDPLTSSTAAAMRGKVGSEFET